MWLKKPAASCSHALPPSKPIPFSLKVFEFLGRVPGRQLVRVRGQRACGGSLRRKRYRRRERDQQRGGRRRRRGRGGKRRGLSLAPDARRPLDSLRGLDRSEVERERGQRGGKRGGPHPDKLNSFQVPKEQRETCCLPAKGKAQRLSPPLKGRLSDLVERLTLTLT